MYVGLLSENAARAIEMIPIIKINSDKKVNVLLILDNNPVIPNSIMMNPTR